MRGTIEEPQGLTYQANFIDEVTECKLLDFLRTVELEPITMHGVTAKRTARHFGRRYDYGSHTLKAGEPIPSQLHPLIRQAEEFAGISQGKIIEALINKYPPGAAIGWHNDAPVYDAIIGISLRSPCILQFQRYEENKRYVFERLINPRSVYIMRGDARDIWQHHIPATKSERYSITLRSLK